MTAPTADPIEAAAAKLTRDEAKILAHYAAGESVDEIARATHISLQAVSFTIDIAAKRDRSRAQKIAVAWQAANPAARANGAPAPRPAPPAVSPPSKRVEEIEVSYLIGRAAESGVPKLVRLAEKAQQLVDELRDQVAEHELNQQLRAEAEQLETRLAEIRQQLGQKRPADAVDTKAVRAWAAANGVECSAFGVIPAGVVAAYRKAAA